MNIPQVGVRKSSVAVSTTWRKGAKIAIFWSKCTWFCRAWDSIPPEFFELQLTENVYLGTDHPPKNLEFENFHRCWAIIPGKTIQICIFSWCFFLRRGCLSNQRAEARIGRNECQLTNIGDLDLKKFQRPRQMASFSISQHISPKVLAVPGLWSTF